ncbi:GNAT family N-acetyltransferase [Enterococcus ureasiticus]|uniref:GNAT family N-acetyltransferase n=1 Tax=Enterococcus ureasiticus TaxID=903984 RepID=A0A1E5GLF1_9ENTE|nr:GNAT family N-acetyltransferase [Enterococcus ureasiticus]OEG13534.1 GNAT family N-acetyltransferase [Enterococcus ureasiticus]
MTSAKWRTLATDLVKKRTRTNTESSFNRNRSKKVRITENVRLIPFDKIRKESLKWYQDPESMRSIVGTKTTYTKEQIQQMYEWQNEHGLLYYIEYNSGKHPQIIGDVWLAEDDYAIVIDRAFRNRHIGRMVTKYFIYKSQKMGRDFITVSEIFNWNKASQKMFTNLDFYPFKENKDSWSYRKRLKKAQKQK